MKRKQKCIIDVYDDHNCNQYYKIETEYLGEAPDCCDVNVFLSESDLEDFLDESVNEIEITKDYRKGWKGQMFYGFLGKCFEP